MKTIIQENQRGFVFQNGKFLKLLEPGKYRFFGEKTVEIAELSQPISSSLCSLDVLLQNDAVAESVSVTEVLDEELVLHFVNGKFCGILNTGKYAFWKIYDRHEFQHVGIAELEVLAEIPRYIFSRIPSGFYTKVEVKEYQKARLFFDRKFVRLLDAGTYFFWNGAVSVEAELVDTRLSQMNLVGQEILSQDKVALRINFVCTYRATDFVKAYMEIGDYQEQLHVAAQLALREAVGKLRIDEILENKNSISAQVCEKLREKAREIYLDIVDAGVKDIILPGEIRDIMNTVLVAEKRAQANVIMRREEVASTRSLLNTAKLMDENQTLYKLKELEYLEKICENVGNITVGGNDSLLYQLDTILRGKANV